MSLILLHLSKFIFFKYLVKTNYLLEFSSFFIQTFHVHFKSNDLILFSYSFKEDTCPFPISSLFHFQSILRHLRDAASSSPQSQQHRRLLPIRRNFSQKIISTLLLFSILISIHLQKKINQLEFSTNFPKTRIFKEKKLEQIHIKKKFQTNSH